MGQRMGPGVVLVLVSCLAGACADDAAEVPSRWQDKHPRRPDQVALSSHAPCYCFPEGSRCHYGPFDSGPTDAPTDVPECVEGEACYASSSWYSAGFEVPRGRCVRLCFHARAELTPDVLTPRFSAYLAMDCAAGEECVLAKIDVGFESHPRALVGLCVAPPPDGTIVTFP